MEERPPESEFPGTSPGASYAPGDLALLEAAFASLAEGVTVHDATGRIVACNRAATTLFGLPADQLLGLSASLRSALDVRYKDGTPVTGENSRVTHVLSTGRPERDCLLQFQLPGAAARSWVRANFQPLVREGAPEPWGVVCSFVDASEGPGADARMREFSRQLRTLFADDSAIVYVKDRDGRYVYANRRLGELLGLQRTEIRRRLEQDKRRPPARHDVGGLLERVVVGRKPGELAALRLHTTRRCPLPTAGRAAANCRTCRRPDAKVER